MEREDTYTSDESLLMTIVGTSSFFKGLGLQNGSNIYQKEKGVKKTNTEESADAIICSFTNLYDKKQIHEQAGEQDFFFNQRF
jgi:hypothetical protein